MTDVRGGDTDPIDDERMPSIDNLSIDTVAIDVVVPATMSVTLPGSPIHDIADDELVDDDLPSDAIFRDGAMSGGFQPRAAVADADDEVPGEPADEAETDEAVDESEVDAPDLDEAEAAEAEADDSDIEEADVASPIDDAEEAEIEAEARLDGSETDTVTEDVTEDDVVEDDDADEEDEDEDEEDVADNEEAVVEETVVDEPATPAASGQPARRATPAARSTTAFAHGPTQSLSPVTATSLITMRADATPVASGPVTPAGVSALRYQTGAPETSALLTAERLLDDNARVHSAPEGFWQRLLYDASLHKVNLGDSATARARKVLDGRIATHLGGGARFVPVLTRKGGVGKTTVTALLGMALADARDDRVIAIDANPDRGTLAERIARPSPYTVRDIVREVDTITGYSEFSRLVARDETRLDVLASDTDPHLAEAFSGDDYDIVADLAAQYYSLVLTDCGTGIVHSVMRATLDRADAVVIVSGGSVDEARLASETLTWLESNGYEHLVQNAVVALNLATSGTHMVRIEEIESHFSSRVREIVRVPYDPHLAAGSSITFKDLKPTTRHAARTLAALVVEGLPVTHD